MMAETQHTQTHPKFTSLDKSGGQKPLDFTGVLVSLPEGDPYKRPDHR
ncbi:hypothetical protein [Xenorhabdus sp. SGI240]